MKISLESIPDTYNVSREVVIAEAISGKFSLYYLKNGAFKPVEKNDLKHLPDPETPLEKQKNNIATRLGLETNLNRMIRVSKGLHIKKEDIELFKEEIEGKENAKKNGPLKRKIKTLERLAGALIVANYFWETRTKEGKYNMAAIQDKLAMQLSPLDFELDLVGKKLDEGAIKSAVLSFHEQQFSEKNQHLFASKESIKEREALIKEQIKIHFKKHSPEEKK